MYERRLWTSGRGVITPYDAIAAWPQDIFTIGAQPLEDIALSHRHSPNYELLNLLSYKNVIVTI